MVMNYKINTIELMFTIIKSIFSNNEYLYFLLQKGRIASSYFELALTDIVYKHTSMKELILKLIDIRLKLIPESIAGEYLSADERKIFTEIKESHEKLQYNVFSLNKLLKEKMSLFRTFQLYQKIQDYTDSSDVKNIFKFRDEIEKYYYDINFDMDYNETILGGEDKEKEILDILETLKRSLSSNICTTGFPKFDKTLTRGGIEGGRLVTIGAPPGAGKSTILLNMALENFKQGKKVMFFTFENSRSETIMRLLANISNTPINELFTRYDKTKQETIENILKKYLHIYNKLGGKFLISFYPVNTITTEQLFEDIIKRKAFGNNFPPDIIFIDYADLLRANVYTKNKQRTDELKAIYIALKKYAVIWDVPIITASQLNRGGVRNSKADIDNFAEAFSKAEIADLGLILRENRDRLDSHIKLYVGKARIGKAGLVINLYRQSDTFKIIEESVGYNMETNGSALGLGLNTLPNKDKNISTEDDIDFF